MLSLGGGTGIRVGFRTRFPQGIESSNLSQGTMAKLKKILQSVRIEEYVLFISSLIVSSVCLILSYQLIGSGYFGHGFRTVFLGVKYFSVVLVFVYLYIFYKLFLYLTNWLSPFYKKNFPKDLSNPLIGVWPRIKNVLINVLVILRPFFLAVVFFSLLTLLLGFFSVYLQESLIDDQLMRVDKSLFSSYPFFWSYDWIPFFKYLSPLIVYSYNLLGTMMGVSWIIFYLTKKREIFSKYIVAMVLSSIIGLILWFIFPALTPQDRYLDNIYGLEINPSIQALIKDYNPDKYVLDFQEEIRLEPDEVGGVSTMPSMHVTWSMIIIYYLFKLKRKTVFITLPWFFLSTWGTFYLAEHYFVDILAALPIIVVVIWLSNLLVKKEKKYYQIGKWDDREDEFKRGINRDIRKISKFFKNLLFVDKKLDK